MSIPTTSWMEHCRCMLRISGPSIRSCHVEDGASTDRGACPERACVRPTARPAISLAPTHSRTTCGCLTWPQPSATRRPRRHAALVKVRASRGSGGTLREIVCDRRGRPAPPTPQRRTPQRRTPQRRTPQRRTTPPKSPHSPHSVVSPRPKLLVLLVTSDAQSHLRRPTASRRLAAC